MNCCVIQFLAHCQDDRSTIPSLSSISNMSVSDSNLVSQCVFLCVSRGQLLLGASLGVSSRSSRLATVIKGFWSTTQLRSFCSISTNSHRSWTNRREISRRLQRSVLYSVETIQPLLEKVGYDIVRAFFEGCTFNIFCPKNVSKKCHTTLRYWVWLGFVDFASILPPSN